MHGSPHRAYPLTPRFRSWWWLVLAAAVAVLTLIAGLIAKSYGRTTPEIGVDVALSHGRNGALTGLSQDINVGIGPVGAVILLVAICLLLLILRRRLWPAVAFGLIVSVGWLSTEIGKIMVGRLRPPVDLVHSLAPETGSDSFPSGHTAFAVALVWAFVVVVGRTQTQKAAMLAAGIIFVALVAFSRLYLGVHYLSDVIGSVFISSAAILALLTLWTNLLMPRKTAAAERGALAAAPD
ncbi:phosphatase PAP2 family protein [Arthrobacter sp. A5]|uniref:phosphatase PAP2 family protein n=1 Tax=Arthrobacter sp. A5 TaxID=576926 RepID=UPI003DA9D044